MNRQQEIVSAESFPLMGLIWGLLGIGMLAVGMIQLNPHWFIASVPAIALACGLFLFRPPQIIGRLEETALVLTVPGITIPYDSIESVTLAGRPQEAEGKLRRGSIVLIHPAGILTIPARLNLPVEDLYRELLQRTAGSGSRDVHGDLQSHAAKEIEIFGEDHVWTFRRRTGHVGCAGNRRQFACFLLLGIAAVFWCVAPFLFFNAAKSSEGMAWLGFGMILAMSSVIGMLTTVKSSRLVKKLVPRWEESSLVISPSGIALIQGDLRGQMRVGRTEGRTIGLQRIGFHLGEPNALARFDAVGRGGCRGARLRHLRPSLGLDRQNCAAGLGPADPHVMQACTPNHAGLPLACVARR